MRSSLVFALSMTSLATPIRSAAAQTYTPRLSPPSTLEAPNVASLAPGRKTQRALGALGGAVVGATMGYLITRAECDGCDDPAPILFGTGVGAVAGAVVGLVVVRPHSLASARREVPRLQLAVRRRV
jgi:hypothetical protein